MALMTDNLPAPQAEAILANARSFVELMAEAFGDHDEAVTDYEPVKRVEAIEHESRSGFWSWNGGGFMVVLPASLGHCWSSGSCPAPLLPMINSGNEILADEWARQHPDRPTLSDCLRADEGEPAYEFREAAQEWEQEAWAAHDGAYFWKARAVFYAASDQGNTSGQDEVYLDAYLCTDLNYGRDHIPWANAKDQTSGSFKMTIPAERFGGLRPEVIERLVRWTMHKMPPYVNCG